MELKVGDKAPEFCLPDQDGNEVCLKDFSGKWVVVYFYPKDNTSGCTKEALGFTEHIDEFEALNCKVLGISKDSVQSHRKFVDRHGLKVTLLSDPEHRVIEAYGAWKLKKRYGREYYGTQRSTFLIDPEGVIRHIWSNVRVKGHMEDVLKVLKELSGQ